MHLGTHLRVFSDCYPMNTNMTGFRGFSKIFGPYALDESSLSIGRVDNTTGKSPVSAVILLIEPSVSGLSLFLGLVYVYNAFIAS